MINKYTKLILCWITFWPNENIIGYGKNSDSKNSAAKTWLANYPASQTLFSIFPLSSLHPIPWMGCAYGPCIRSKAGSIPEGPKCFFQNPLRRFPRSARQTRGFSHPEGNNWGAEPVSLRKDNGTAWTDYFIKIYLFCLPVLVEKKGGRKEKKKGDWWWKDSVWKKCWSCSLQ